MTFALWVKSLLPEKPTPGAPRVTSKILGLSGGGGRRRNNSGDLWPLFRIVHCEEPSSYIVPSSVCTNPVSTASQLPVLREVRPVQLCPVLTPVGFRNDW